MQQGHTYRVYSPNDLQSIAPTSLRSAPPPQKSGFFGFGFAILVVIVLIGGASFGAQRFIDGKLATQSLHAGVGTGDSAVAPAPALNPPASASASASASPSASAQVPSAFPTPNTPMTPKVHRKLRHRRTPPNTGLGGLKDSPDLLPANPYDDTKVDDVPRK